MDTSKGRSNAHSASTGRGSSAGRLPCLCGTDDTRGKFQKPTAGHTQCMARTRGRAPGDLMMRCGVGSLDLAGERCNQGPSPGSVR